MDKKNDVPKEHLLAGTKIKYFYTIGSWYANGYLSVHFVNNAGLQVCGRIHVNTLLQMVNEFGFTMVMKRKYVHLEDPVLVLDADAVEVHEKYGFI